MHSLRWKQFHRDHMVIMVLVKYYMQLSLYTVIRMEKESKNVMVKKLVIGSFYWINNMNVSLI